MNATRAWRDLQQQMQRAIVPAGGQFATITSAFLVWPLAEEIAAATPGKLKTKKNRFDRAGLWFDDHVDKLSQVRWIQEHPDQPLAELLPKPQFLSRYADPNHAASSGDVVALMTGGQWHLKPKDEKVKAKEKKSKTEDPKSKDSKGSIEEYSVIGDPVNRSERDNHELDPRGQDKHKRKQKAAENLDNSSKQRQGKDDTKDGFSSLLQDVCYAFGIVVAKY
jgi:hypothetical protein